MKVLSLNIIGKESGCLIGVLTYRKWRFGKQISREVFKHHYYWKFKDTLQYTPWFKVENAEKKLRDSGWTEPPEWNPPRDPSINTNELALTLENDVLKSELRVANQEITKLLDTSGLMSDMVVKLQTSEREQNLIRKRYEFRLLSGSLQNNALR